jgi:Uma2 family endonuclease
VAPVEHKRRATYEDLLALPEHLVGEIIDGELVASPRPGPRHARVSSVLGGELVGPFDRGRGGPGGWVILDEPELHLHDDVVVPDLAAWRRERLPELPAAAHFSVAPDWVCEVLSPSTERIDRVRKLRIYARDGVAWAWLLNPVEQTLEVLHLDGGGWRIASLHEGAARIRAAPFEALELDLEALWTW